MQLKTSKIINSFDKAFREKWPFEEYIDETKPTLFFGMYNANDIKAATRHTGKKIIWFAGIDAMSKEHLTFMKTDSAFKDAVFVAESKWIENDLDAVGIKYESISILMDDIYNWKSEPLGDSLYWYNAESRRYGREYIKAVKNAFPGMNIIMPERGAFTKNEMPEIYKKCFAGVRTVRHDGMSQSVAEMGLMGRMSIWNGVSPFTMPYDGTEGLIAAIKHLREEYNHKVVSKRARGYFISGETALTNLILKLCGTEELDVANIFYESVGKCGSIFRISRKSDIDKIGGFGKKQFERPWFSKEMSKLKKKQLVTSKNSGFVAYEWKNSDGKKGFLNNEFNTHDRGTRKCTICDVCNGCKD